MAVHLLFQITACFLAVEMVLLVTLLLPFVKAKTWKRLYQSALWSRIRQAINRSFGTGLKYQYFVVAIVAIVTVAFLDSANDVYRMYFPDKLSGEGEITGGPCDLYIKEESYYRESKTLLITGFTLYMAIVLLLLRDTIEEKASLEEQLSNISSSEEQRAIETLSSEEIEAIKKEKMEATLELNETKEALSKALAELDKMKTLQDIQSEREESTSTDHQDD
ncbi:B-cell receptor-associated protein 29-like [Ptychodera flava]|uniref:B-cell receptor-associated protein 29-like n=1 Tax=Ptychodera flava TaxID=63121 RepID=UPI003969F334